MFRQEAPSWFDDFTFLTCCLDALHATGKGLCLLRSGSRMRLVVGLFQTFRGQVRVSLGRDQMRVSEQLLHAAQISARVEQVSRVAVAELVRRQLRIQP